MVRWTVAVVLALALPIASADAPRFGRNDVRTVFFIAKSQNGNRVHYGVRLGADCSPRGVSPIFAYWRMEDGDLEDLLSREQRAYGIASQRRVAGDGTHHRLRIQLRAVERPIDVVTLRSSSGRCQAGAETRIDGTPAELHSVFIQLRSSVLPRVAHIRLRGREVRHGRWIQERIVP